MMKEKHDLIYSLRTGNSDENNAASNKDDNDGGQSLELCVRCGSECFT